MWFNIGLMMATYAQQLADLQTVINRIQSGDATSISINGRATTLHNLDTLYKREQYLMKMAGREASGNANSAVCQSLTSGRKV